MTALCFVIGDKVEMPAGCVQSVHIIGAVQSDYRTRNVVIVKFSLVCFERLVERLIWLFLLDFAAHVHLFEGTAHFYKVEKVFAVFLNHRIELFL